VTVAGVADPLTWVVTIRVWREPDALRLRLLVGVPGGGDPVEIVSSSIEEACAALAVLVSERIG
jgi:hypothetical protein